jgi:hypothetical protein
MSKVDAKEKNALIEFKMPFSTTRDMRDDQLGE